MATITLTADDSVIEAARRRAEQERTTLDQAMKEWLEDYAEAGGPLPGEGELTGDERVARYERAMAMIRGKVTLDRMPTRDEMNAR